MSLHQKLRRHDKLLVIIGPSGAGKSTIVNRLIQEGIVELTPSYTTRPSRKQAVHDLDHVFVDDERFNQLERDGFFLNTASLFGLPYRYGLPSIETDDMSRIPAIVLRASLLTKLSAHYENPVIYQIEATEETVRQRLIRRGDKPDEINKRLTDYNKEIEAGRAVAHRIVSNDHELDQLIVRLRTSLFDDFSYGL